MSNPSEQIQHSQLHMPISCVSNLLSGDGGLSGLEVRGHVFIVHLYVLYSSSLHVVSTPPHVLHTCMLYTCMLYTCVCCTPVYVVHLCMLYTCVCCTPVHVVHLCMLYTCACCTPVYVVHLCTLYTCVCCTPVHVVHMYAYGIWNTHPIIPQRTAANVVLKFVRHTQKTMVPHISRPSRFTPSSHLSIDASSRRNLELLQ